MTLEIIHPGMLCLLQDYGRYGMQHQGITQGGPLDEHAFLWANHLLGNHYNAAQLEITIGGFSARFKKPAMIALCGADMNAQLNDLPLPLWQSIAVKAGDTLQLASARSGLRAYLAIKGGFNVAKQLGSCATVIREGIGGLNQDGQALTKNTVLAFSASQVERSRYVPQQFIPAYQTDISLRFIANQSATGCGEQALAAFIQQPYTITDQIDRMGYRLQAKPIESSKTGIISQGITLGAIQLPKDGQPIVLMRDRQTMGGYPQLGCVAHLDLPLLAQSRPGTRVRFIPASIEELEPELREYRQFFQIEI